MNNTERLIQEANRYGKNHAISDYFKNDAELQQFETEILSQIEKTLS